MTVDPEFPNRPQHPDFWAMSRSVVERDRAVDESGDLGKVLDEANVDTDSLLYMARQRALRMIQNTPTPETDEELMVSMASLWMDAFLVGLDVGSEKAVTQVLEKGSDGNRRGIN